MSVYNSNGLKAKLTKYLLMPFGLLLYALGWNLFLFPHHIAGGGVTGIAAIIMYGTAGLLPDSMVAFFSSIGMETMNGGIPVSLSYFVINSILLLLALKLIGKDFTLKSIIGSLVAMVWLWIPFRDLYAKWFGEQFPVFDPFMSCIIAGIMTGLGLAISFSLGGSSGGTDVVAKITNKYFGWSIGRSLLFCDVLIISSSILLPTNGLENVVYGLITMAVCSGTVDMYINGTRQSVQFFIFSKHYEQIADAIVSQTGRGVTAIDGEGWYTKSKTKMLTVMARKNESTQIFKIIKSIDPDAFISQSAVMGVYGRGFDTIGKG